MGDIIARELPHNHLRLVFESRGFPDPDLFRKMLKRVMEKLEREGFAPRPEEVEEDHGTEEASKQRTLTPEQSKKEVQGVQATPAELQDLIKWHWHEMSGGYDLELEDCLPPLNLPVADLRREYHFGWRYGVIFPYLPYATARFPEGYPFSWSIFVYGKRATFNEIDVTIEAYCAVELVSRPKAEDDPGVAGYIRDLADAIQKQFAKQQLKDEHSEWNQEKLATVFISYSSKDKPFAERLHNDLQGKGVRCWFAPEDMRIGDRIRPTIDQAVRSYDKLLLVLSEHSIDSDWVEKEVETAFSLPYTFYQARHLEFHGNG